jgi:hypothetical protein
MRLFTIKEAEFEFDTNEIFYFTNNIFNRKWQEDASGQNDLQERPLYDQYKPKG